MGQYKYETKKGTRWTAKFRYTDSASGERKVMYKRGFLTKRDAHEFEKQFRFDLEDYDPAKADLDKKTFGDVYKEYMASFKLEDMKQNSLRTKETVFVHHIFPYFMDVPIRSITSESIHAWQQKIKGSKKDNGDPYSPDYLRTIQTQFNSIINYANSKIKTIIICIVIVLLISIIFAALCKCTAEADRQFDVACMIGMQRD